MKITLNKTAIALMISIMATPVLADNPLVTHMYTADPTARVFNGKMYVFPSTDVVCKEGFGNNGFCMPSYNVFSSDNLVDWTDHGLVIDQKDVTWGEPEGFGMWAPDAVEKDGKYYFYFPDIPKDKSVFRRIAVAVADKPEGPYKVLDKPIQGIDGIDPNAFVDDDGQAYLYWGGGEKLFVAKLKPNMIEIEGKPQVIEGLPTSYKEGPFMFKRNGQYYFTFPHAPQGSEELAYATGTDPMGPFDYKGLFMERWRDSQWTNHHSVVEFKGQWYVFYHHQKVSGNKHLRSMEADFLHFNADGSIQKVIPTLRGIGTASAQNKIQVDRYSVLSDRRAKVSEKQKGSKKGEWVVDWIEDGGFVQYDRIDFGQGLSNITVNASSATKGGVIEVRLSGSGGELVGKVEVSNTGNWNTFKNFTTKLDKKLTGVQNLAFVFRSHESYQLTNKELMNSRNNQKNKFLFNLDWVSFD